MTEREALKLALEALEEINKLSVGENAICLPAEIDTAMDACRKVLAQPEQEHVATSDTSEKRVDEMAKQRHEQEPVANSVVAGALFDFMGWLTSRKERIVLSSADNASPAVEAITKFAKMRNLSLDDAKVQDWNTAPPQPEPVIDKSAAVRIATSLGWEPKRKPLTDVEIWNTYKNLWMFHPAEEPRLAGDILKFARAIEAAHGIKE